MTDPVLVSGPGTRVAPGGATDARPTPGAALTNAILGPQLSGLPAQPDHQAAIQGLMKALGLPENTQITDRNADQIQARLLRHLGQQLGVDVGQPPSLEKAREAMISALQNQPGMSREELSNASLTDLMARYKGMREQQARTPQDGVDPPGRRAAPGGEEPPAAPGDPRRGGPATPRSQRGVRTGGRHQARVTRGGRQQRPDPAAARRAAPAEARPPVHRARAERPATVERPVVADPEARIRAFAGEIDTRFAQIRTRPEGERAAARAALVRETGITPQNLELFQAHLRPETLTELRGVLTPAERPAEAR